jgi:hypothetical protein
MAKKDKVVALNRAASDGRSTRATRETEPASTRVPWNGGLSDEELARPGGALMSALLYRANQLGHQLAQMSTELNVTYGYISQLRSGHRHPENISDDFVNAAAAYLGVPRMTVLMLCGRVKPDDVLLQKHNVAQQIPAAMDFIAQDPVFGPLMPLEARKQSYELQFFIISMYEKATGKTLLSGRHDPVEFAGQMAELLAQRAELMQTVEVARAAKAKSA